MLEGNLSAMTDARRRLLTPGGTLIPGRDRLLVAPVNAPNLYKDYEEPWEQNALGLDLSSGVGLVRNTWRKALPKPEQVV